MIACNVPLFSLFNGATSSGESLQKSPTTTATSTEIAANLAGKSDQMTIQKQATATYTATPTQTPTATDMPGAVGPVDYPNGINPLTGLSGRQSNPAKPATCHALDDQLAACCPPAGRAIFHTDRF